MSKRIVDAVIYLDGLHLDDGESMDDVANFLKENFRIDYDVMVSVDYEEIIDD